MEQTLTYTELKAIILQKSLPWQYRDMGDRLEIWAMDSGVLYKTTVYKDGAQVGGIDVAQHAADLANFTANYAAAANARLAVQLDSDGAPMSRTKVAPSGWNFQFRGVEFATSTLGSIVNRDANNVDLADATLKLYNAAGAVITDQAVADTDCVKATLDIEPPYDIYIAGGKLKFVQQPTEDVRIAVIGVPDVPAAYGGSKHFVQNVNLKFISATDGVNADGRAAKWLQYSATLHTNKIRFVVHHPAGHKMPIAVYLEVYRQ